MNLGACMSKLLHVGEDHKWYQYVSLVVWIMAESPQPISLYGMKQNGKREPEDEVSKYFCVGREFKKPLLLFPDCV